MSIYKMDDTEMRAHYCNALIAAAKEDSRILVLDVDTSVSMGTVPFYEAFPARAINCGIMEAHAAGMAAGLSATGFVPFLQAFGTFASRRAFDQVFLSCAYQHLNVRVIGEDAGVTAAGNGGTHMPLEDMALMRSIPGMTVIEPADGMALRAAVRHMAKAYGNFYMRFGRRKMTRIYGPEEPLEIGKAKRLRDGKDAAVIACGIMVYEALKAAEALREEGIDITVLDMHTVKPIDRGAVMEAALRCGAVVTAENHNVIGGLGSAVAEVLGEYCPAPLERVGVRDTFGEVGSQEYLMEKFGLTAAGICIAVKKAMQRRDTPCASRS